MPRLDDLTHVVDAPVDRLQNRLARVQCQPEAWQEGVDAVQRAIEPVCRLVQQHHVIDIARVVPGTDAVLHMLVQLVEQDVREELRRQVADWQPVVSARIDQALVRWYRCQGCRITPHNIVRARVVEQHGLRESAPPALRNLLHEQWPEHPLIDGHKEVRKIGLQIEARPAPVLCLAANLGFQAPCRVERSPARDAGA